MITSKKLCKMDKNNTNICVISQQIVSTISTMQEISVDDECNKFFRKLCEDINIIGCDWTKQIISNGSKKIVCINKLFLTNSPGCAKIEKQILVFPTCCIKLFVFDEEINPVDLALSTSMTTPDVKIQTEDGLQQFINWFNNVEVCQGGPLISKYTDDIKVNIAHHDSYLNVWRHNNCPVILPVGLKNICKLCSTIDLLLKRKEDRVDKKPLMSTALKLNVLREIKKDYMPKEELCFEDN